MRGSGDHQGAAPPERAARDACHDGPAPSRRRRAATIRSRSVIVALSLLGGIADAQAQFASFPAGPSQRSTAWAQPPGTGAAGFGQAPLQLVQGAKTPERPLDARIQGMPVATEELQVIHRRSQLVLTRQNVRRIAVTDPAIVEVVQYTPTEMAILGVGMGTTDVWIWFEGSESPLMYVVTVIRDPSLDEQRRIDYGKLERKLAVLYPNSKVYLSPLSRKIIVRGQARDAEEAARIMQIVRDEIINQEGDLFLSAYGGPNNVRMTLTDYDTTTNGFYNFLSSFIVNELEVPGEFQIMTRVRIAEINRSQLRRMGLDWEYIFNDARHVITQTFAAAAPQLTGIFENGEITVLLDALASNGSGKVLTDATVVALSGEPASFLAGGEFAVPSTVGLNGVGVATTTFRGFGTSLISTSTLVDRDLIRMEIIPELSELDQGAAVGGVPGVNVRRVQTRVELREGQTIVLGGVFSRRQRAEVTRIPVLGEIPIVGTYLFNTKQATEDETEMLIVLTPEIVRPMDPEEVPPLPGWYLTHPDDFDLCRFNRIEGNPDLGHYQLLPYGNGQGYAQDAGYNIHNPAPVDAQISPMATGQYPGMMQPGYGAPPGGYYGGGGGGGGAYPMNPGYAPPTYPAPGYPAPTYPPQPYPQGTAPAYGAPQSLRPAPPATLPELQPTPADPRGPQVHRQGSRGGVQQASGTAPARRSWFSRR